AARILIATRNRVGRKPRPLLRQTTARYQFLTPPPLNPTLSPARMSLKCNGRHNHRRMQKRTRRHASTNMRDHLLRAKNMSPGLENGRGGAPPDMVTGALEPAPTVTMPTRRPGCRLLRRYPS